jgi:hypothetical protein
MASISYYPDHRQKIDQFVPVVMAFRPTLLGVPEMNGIS